MVKQLQKYAQDSIFSCSQSKKSRQKVQKRSWTEEQDQVLIKAIQEIGPHKWTLIARRVPNRLGKQCRERWYNHLNPRISKTDWSEKQQWMLFLAHYILGNKWSEISKVLPGRTDNSIKNQWNSSMKKMIDQFSRRLRILLVKEIDKESATNEEYQLLQIIQNGDVGGKEKLTLCRLEHSRTILKPIQQSTKVKIKNKNKPKSIYANLNLEFDTPQKILFEENSEEPFKVKSENPEIVREIVVLESPSNYLANI